MGDWYDESGAPATGSPGSSATIRGELTLISDSMDKLPTYTGNGDKIVVVNSGGTSLTVATSLSVAQGGTGAATLTDGGILLGSGTGAVTATAVMADGEILVGDGTTNPVLESGATARTSLGLTIGTDVQAFNTNTVIGPGTIADNALVRFDTTTGKLLQASGIDVDDNDNVAGAGVQANAQTGTTYTGVIGDAGKLITLSNASAITFTIPANASVAYPVGTVINLVQLGAGQVTVAITSDTLNSPDSRTKLKGQYSLASIIKITSTSWVLSGDIVV